MSSHGLIKNRFLQLGIVTGFVDLFKTTGKTSYAKKALRRLKNDIKELRVIRDTIKAVLIN